MSPPIETHIYSSIHVLGLEEKGLQRCTRMRYSFGLAQTVEHTHDCQIV